MTFQTVDDILAHCGGDREARRDDTEGSDVVSGSGKEEPGQQTMGEDLSQ